MKRKKTRSGEQKKKSFAKKSSDKNAGRVVAVSGGFDPVHVGHVRLIRAAKALGDELVVILNNDHWLRAKKGYAFMPENQRKEILEALGDVDRVVITDHFRDDTDRSVARALKKVRPHIFANGGDRNAADAANPQSSLYKDLEACRECDISVVFNVGKGGKIASSSHLAASAARTLKKGPRSIARRRKSRFRS